MKWSNYQESFEGMYNRYYPVLCNYAACIVKNRTEAEDIVGDVFLSLLEENKVITVETSMKAYLFKSTYNKCMNVLKHQAVQGKYIDYVKQLDFLNRDESYYPLASLIETELMDVLEKTIEKLPPQCRSVFRMSRDGEMSYEEIAKELNISVHTVHMQMKRALSKIKFEMKDFLTFLIWGYFS